MNKKEARVLARRLRAGAPPEYAREVLRFIGSLPCFLEARQVMAYCAFGGEIDVLPLDCAGRAFAYPVCGGGMVAAVPGSWNVGLHGIREPDLACSRVVPAGEIDLALVPCLAFNAAGVRLGQGGGYYDRFLPHCKNAVKVGVAYSTQLLEFETAPHDAVLDIIVTELGCSLGNVHLNRKKNHDRISL